MKSLLMRYCCKIMALASVGLQFDTLKGSKHNNMKELRFDWKSGVWRIAFAFDPKSQAVLLAAADKSGSDQKRVYKKLITLADRRYDRYLLCMSVEKKGR